MPKEVHEEVFSKARSAKEASRQLAVASSQAKNHALEAMAQALEKKYESILEANEVDMEAAKAKGFNRALLDRLLLTQDRIVEMANGLRALLALDDPIGETIHMWTRPNSLEIGKVRVPLGVVGMIYEARPNVTVDAAGLCLKTGNAVLLRGGSEAINSNIALTRIIAAAAEGAGMPAGCIQLIESTDREAVNLMMTLNQYLDVLIPRGGAGLIQAVVQNATVPVIETGVGNCHVYVDEDADIAMAAAIVVNAKTQRPAVCNAAETLLVHKNIAEKALVPIAEKLQAAGVELRGCPQALALVPGMKEATEEDWATEYLDLIMAVKIVDSFEEAVDHINRYGSKHSEAIVTNSYQRARRFQKEVDAACVYVNASTRFTDGYQFGFGAEIGISTQKLHARGPMGLEALTSIKYVINGEGQIRQ